jgi:hypothetical protein
MTKRGRAWPICDKKMVSSQITRRYEMQKMFDSMMNGFFSGMPEEDGHRMKDCVEKMKAMCPCCNMKELSEVDKKATMEKMRSFCGGKMGMRSSVFECPGVSK